MSDQLVMLKSKPIRHAVRTNLQHISNKLMKIEDFDVANDIVEMLDLLGSPEDYVAPSVEFLLKLTRSIIRYFLLCIEEHGNYLFKIYLRKS